MDAGAVVLPLVINILAVGVGVGLGFLLKWLISERRSQEHRLVLVVGVLMGLTGLCTLFDVSPLLSCMALGTAYVNCGGNKNLFKQVNRFTPPILLLFFVLSGLRLNIPSPLTGGGDRRDLFLRADPRQIRGASLGAWLTGAPTAVRRYLGLALIPQAGVSIGLAALGQRLLPESLGSLLSTIILSSAVLYEMVGPACAKASLRLSHTIAKPAPPLPASAPPAPERPAGSGKKAKGKKKALRTAAQS